MKTRPVKCGAKCGVPASIYQLPGVMVGGDAGAALPSEDKLLTMCVPCTNKAHSAH